MRKRKAGYRHTRFKAGRQQAAPLILDRSGVDQSRPTCRQRSFCSSSLIFGVHTILSGHFMRQRHQRERRMEMSAYRTHCLWPRWKSAGAARRHSPGPCLQEDWRPAVLVEFGSAVNGRRMRCSTSTVDGGCQQSLPGRTGHRTARRCPTSATSWLRTAIFSATGSM